MATFILVAATCFSEPHVVAHRGASAQAPENTIAAFELAWKQNADAIEGDFHLTKDGHIVCIHDYDTRRVSSKKLVVRESTLAQLRKLEVGGWKSDRYQGDVIPTIDEVLARVPQGKQIFVEVKCGPEIVPALLKAIEASKLNHEQIVVISFHADVIKSLKAKAPRFKANWLTSFKRTNSETKPTTESVLATLKECNATGLGSSSSIPQSTAKAVLQAGYEWHVWTVDDPKAALRFIDWGVQSITTNKPGLIRDSVLAAP